MRARLSIQYLDLTEICAVANSRSHCRWWSTILSTLLLSLDPLTPFKLVRLEPRSLSLIISNEGRAFMLQAKPGKKTNIVNLFAKIHGLKELSEVNSLKICVYLQYSELTDWQQRGVFGTSKDFKALL